jgi:A/G-specific adenine glycosylase
MPPTLRSAIRRNLLRWYRENKRDLPWRRTPDPYAIWISETMLQQTQVNTVIPYYEKFLATFPTVHALARAPLSKVLRLWAGLGYYRRAKHLRTAAQQIVKQYAGTIPQDFAQLRALAGIGDYTAGALLSIAFGKRYPAVDGNARRVLSRILRITDERALRQIAAELVPAAKPGDFNQALMELGAMVCTPKNQRCADCVVSSLCASRTSARGVPALSARARMKFKSVVWPLAIVARGEKVLLRRRSGNGLLAGLWELPGKELGRREEIGTALTNQLHDLGLSMARAKKIGEIRHAITHRRIRAPIYVFALDGKEPAKLARAHWRWITPVNLQKHATSSMTAKAVALFSSHEANLS